MGDGNVSSGLFMLHLRKCFGIDCIGGNISWSFRHNKNREPFIDQYCLSVTCIQRKGFLEFCKVPNIVAYRYYFIMA